MTLPPSSRKEMVIHEIERAAANLNEARQCAAIGLWNVVGNRIYYAVFHAVVGLLIQNKLEVGSHKGAGMMFGKHFVLTGIFSSEEGKLYRRLQSIREQADYDNVYNLEPEKGKLYLEEATKLIEKIKQLISDNFKSGDGVQGTE